MVFGFGHYQVGHMPTLHLHAFDVKADMQGRSRRQQTDHWRARFGDRRQHHGGHEVVVVDDVRGILPSIPRVFLLFVGNTGADEC